MEDSTETPIVCSSQKPERASRTLQGHMERVGEEPPQTLQKEARWRGTRVSGSSGATSNCRREQGHSFHPNHSPSLGLPISALPASVPPRCQSTHPTALNSTKNSHPRSSTCHFYTPSSSCLPSAAVPAFLPAPCLPSSHLLLGF